ncbi:MAG TPA: M50 family metallopeptidase [Bacilli bacterium]
MGTTYRLHPLFIMVMMVSVATGFFSELMTLFGIVVIHEIGHVAAAKSFGWRVKEVQLLPFGGVVVVDDQGSVNAWQEMVVALAGPLQNALMVGLAYLLVWCGIWEQDWAVYFIKANLIIGLFNLFPLLPLDGGKIMQSLLSLLLSYHRTIVCCTVISLLLSFVMVMVSVYPGGQGIQLNLLLIGLFLFYSNWHDYKNLPYHFLRFLINRGEKVSLMMERGVLAQPIIVDHHITISQILRLFMREQYHLIYIVNQGGHIQAVLPEQKVLNYYFIDNKPSRAISEILM